MSKPIKNVVASVRHKLANRAKESKRPFAELLRYYAIERFLYRLSRSEYTERLALNSIANLVKPTRQYCEQYAKTGIIARRHPIFVSSRCGSRQKLV